MTPEFRLYCFAQSGNAFKVALMLNLCGAKWEPRFVDFFNGETRTPQYREKINEMGEVPVLEHRGKRLAQSGVILHYLADHFRKFQGEDRQEVLRWILWDNHKLTSYIATLRFFVRFQKTGETPVTEFRRGRVKTSLARRIRRILVRVPAHRRVARAHPQAARLGASLRADAGPSVEELKG